PRCDLPPKDQVNSDLRTSFRLAAWSNTGLIREDFVALDTLEMEDSSYFGTRAEPLRLDCPSAFASSPNAIRLAPIRNVPICLVSFANTIASNPSRKTLMNYRPTSCAGPTGSF